MRHEDAELLKDVAAGKLGSFEELFRRYHRGVAGFLYRMTGDAEVVEELVNDVMVVVWKKAGDFAGRSRVSTWILGVAYRMALQAVRRMARLPTFVEIEPPMLIDDGDAHTKLAEAERRKRVFAALAQLTPDHRAVVVLTFYGGHSYREIAEIVGCPENTVKTRMFHARRRLRSLMRAAEERATSGDGKAERR